MQISIRMASLIPSYEYDIFISYRQKDNKGERWVSEFVEALKTELESTFKEDVSLYFDENPHDRLQETHNVDKSLEGKLKCLIVIPILSQTYCDPNSYAWQNEFLPFIKMAENDRYGKDVRLRSGNVASRILPIRIHDLEKEDIKLFEKETGCVLRPMDFVFNTSSGVNRPLRANEDHPNDNLNKIFYRDQVNKMAHAIKEIILGMRTEPLQIVKEKDQIREPSKEVWEGERNVLREKPAKLPRKNLLISIIFIGALLVIVAIFIYPKIFGNWNSLNAMTLPVTVINENGEKEVRRIFKDSYVIRLALFPFVNVTNDSSNNWLQYGLPNAIGGDLSQFNYVILRENKDVNHLQEQIKDAKANNYHFFLTGAFQVAGGIYQITSKLYQTSNGTIVAERIFKGNDFFSIIDSISLQTRIDLGISKILINSSPDLPFMEQSTNNINAFQYFIRGLYIDSLNTNLRRSIELDSTFATALFKCAFINYYYQKSYESALKDINQAMRHRQRLSEYNNIFTRISYYSIHGENDRAIILSEMQNELKPKDAVLLSDLRSTYGSNFMIQKNKKAAQQLTELIPNDPYSLNILANSYLLTGELDKGLEVLKKLLKASSEDVDALLLMGEIYLHNNDPEVAEKMYQKAILIQPEHEKDWSRIFDHITYSRKNPIKSEFLEQFAGNYRFESGEMIVAFFIHNNYLIGKAKNQEPIFSYPVSDTQFTALNGEVTFTFVKNNQGEVIKTIHNQNGQTNIVWKEDSLILKAVNLLNEENKTEALYAFREAFARNPEHYYLANYVRHLEFIQSEEYKRIKPVIETYIGKYGDMIIFKEKNNLYYKGYNGYMYKLLPISEEQFMIPSFYNLEIQIIKKNNSIEGLQVIYRDGKKEFFSRNN
jgi:tetratricopeptide (TPR) repeat protein